MNENKLTARIVGTLFLIAMATSLIGGLWMETYLTAPDYLESFSANAAQVTTGVMLELINGIAVVFIAVLMFPIFKKQNEAMALGYVAFRVIEAVIIISAVISPLVLVILSREISSTGTLEVPGFHELAVVMLSVRELLVGQLLGIFFSLAALIFYGLLYKSRLIPRWISVWGLLGAISILTWNLLELFGFHISFGMIFGLLIITNEIFLGFWLIIKGFNKSEIESAK